VRNRGTVTLAEMLVLALLVLAAVVFLVMMDRSTRRAREEARRIRCRGNLNQLAKGMATYVGELGDNRFYPCLPGYPGCGTVARPTFGGAEWLASLYWTKVIPDPGVFNCPNSPDSNEMGVLLGSFGCPGGEPLLPQAVSYAGMGHDSMAVYVKNLPKWVKGLPKWEVMYPVSGGAIRDDFPPNEAMGSDDTEEPINHGSARDGCMSVLLFDSHVELWTQEKVDLERGVGSGALVLLRN